MANRRDEKVALKASGAARTDEDVMAMYDVVANCAAKKKVMPKVVDSETNTSFLSYRHC